MTVRTFTVRVSAAGQDDRTLKASVGTADHPVVATHPTGSGSVRCVYRHGAGRFWRMLGEPNVGDGNRIGVEDLERSPGSPSYRNWKWAPFHIPDDVIGMKAVDAHIRMTAEGLRFIDGDLYKAVGEPRFVLERDEDHLWARVSDDGVGRTTSDRFVFALDRFHDLWGTAKNHGATEEDLEGIRSLWPEIRDPDVLTECPLAVPEYGYPDGAAGVGKEILGMFVDMLGCRADEIGRSYGFATGIMRLTADIPPDHPAGDALRAMRAEVSLAAARWDNGTRIHAEALPPREERPAQEEFETVAQTMEKTVAEKSANGTNGNDALDSGAELLVRLAETILARTRESHSAGDDIEAYLAAYQTAGLMELQQTTMIKRLKGLSDRIPSLEGMTLVVDEIARRRTPPGA